MIFLQQWKSTMNEYWSSKASSFLYKIVLFHLDVLPAERHPENKGGMHGNASYICLFKKKPWIFLRAGFNNEWAATKGLGGTARNVEKKGLLDDRQLDGGLDDSIVICLWQSEVHVYNLPVHDRWLHYSWWPITHLDAKPELGRVFQHVHWFLIDAPWSNYSSVLVKERSVDFELLWLALARQYLRCYQNYIHV